MKNEKIKVYLYIRVSTLMQMDGYSLDAQKNKMKAFCDYNGYEIAGEYEEAGKSGNVPMIMFLSDGKEVKGTNWIENHYDYVSDLTDAKVIELGCGQSVHNFMQDRIAEDIKEFIGK